MSQLNIQTTMNKLEQPSTKGSTVYMILYNYSIHDYSVITIIADLDDAYKYICSQNQYNDKIGNCKMVEVKTKTDLTNLQEEYLYIAYFTNNVCHHYCMEDYDNVSDYVIVPMTIC